MLVLNELQGENAKAGHGKQTDEQLAAAVAQFMPELTLVFAGSHTDALGLTTQHRFRFLLMLLDRLNDDHIRLIEVLQQARSCPLMVFVNDAAPDRLKRIVDLDVSVAIQGPFEARRLPTLCAIATARFETHNKLYSELAEARQRLADRKVLDRAKGLLMAQRQMTEPQAYALLRKQAMDKGLRLGVVAQQVIDTLELLANDSTDTGSAKHNDTGEARHLSSV